jgi:hypothetical protein
MARAIPRYERYAEPPYPPRYTDRCVPREVVRDQLLG